MGKALIYLSLVFVAHASYSAYEFVSGAKRGDSAGAPIPIDIVIELLLASVVYCIGVVLYAAQTPLKVVKRNVWAKDQRHRDNNRLGFVDILKRRRDYSLEHAGTSTASVKS